MRNDLIQCGLAFIAAIASPGATTARDSAERVDFASQVLPVLASRCFECHGPDEASREAGLRLDTKTGALTELADGKVVVEPGDSAGSEMFRRIATSDDDRMPPPGSGKQLTRDEVDLIKRWIEQGAQWDQHWSLTPLQRPGVPRFANSSRTPNPIDAFVRRRLDKHGLKPTVEADRPTLIRRVTLDLTGLPPTLDEIDAFLADESPDAYERLVDRLLASPQYGERMAVPWLDAARYADTHGYLFDTERSMWRWRDWVIDSFNRNQPYDEFTIEQLAGDLLPNPTESQRIATGFNRNHLINNEAGAIAAEYLVENVVDRVNTTATVWMGLSLACCQCHDHKYDPFTQREYYELYAFFNTLPEAGLDGLNSNAKPIMKAPTALDRSDLDDLRRRVGEAERRMESLGAKIESGQSQWEATYALKGDAPTEGLLAHWAFDGSADDVVVDDPPTVFEAAPAAFQEGILGEAASLEGLGYLNAGDRFDFTSSDAFSVSAWVRPSTKTGRLSVFSRMRDAKESFRGYTLQTFAGVPSFFLIHRFPDDMIQVQAKDALEPDRWHHVAITYDGSGKAAGATLYVNGTAQKPTVVVDKLAGAVVAESPFWIGNGHPGAKMKGLIDDVRVYDRVLAPKEVQRLPGLSVDSLLAIAKDRRNDEQSRRVRRFYLEHHAPARWRESYELLGRLKADVSSRERAVPTVMVMQEAKKPRETTMLIRGAYDRPGEKVRPATPAVLPPFPEEFPRDRLGLAQWLTSPTHPLTARVAVNRFWQTYFGTGLAATAGDFGVQGERPSHPELLDWLACQFVDSGWDVKALQKLIVASATYRQDSRVTPELLSLDPQNRLLARGPRRRLPAETIRDQALSVSGLLVPTIGGPSVRPYQPPGLWRDVAFDFSGANLTAQIYQQDSGASLYRRSLYTFWKRTAPPPSMLLFDAPDRERCVVRRERTSTPLQALVLMNDPTYVEAARKLAERAMTEARGDPPRRIAHAFRVVTARTPRAEELTGLVGLFEKQQKRFADNDDLVDALLDVGESKSQAADRRDLAAYTIVASVILNTDEAVTPR